MSATLTNNAHHLATAIEVGRHCEPASRIVRDGNHDGTLFTWTGREWIVFDLDGNDFRCRCDRIAVVTLRPGDPDAADRGLHQAAIGWDMEVQPEGEWVIDAEDLDSLRKTYGDELVVRWEQV